MPCAATDNIVSHHPRTRDSRNSWLNRCLVLALCVLVHLPLLAQNPENWCRHGSFLHDPDFRLAEVAGAENSPVHFLNDDGRCPNAEENCQTARSVAPGDRVLVSRTVRGYSCAWFAPAKGAEKVGWLPAAKLKTVEPPAEDLIGAWRYYDNVLRVRPGSGSARLRVLEGEAYWHGTNNLLHYGSVRASAVPQDRSLDVRQSGCRMVLRIVGPFMVASDNAQCGGLNVRFDGVYQKESPPDQSPSGRGVAQGGLPPGGGEPGAAPDGATIANIDLGHMDVSQIQELDIPGDLKEKFTPYLGSRSAQAEDFLRSYPLTLTEAQAKTFTESVWALTLRKVESTYNKARSGSVPAFNKLPEDARTVLADLAFVFGPDPSAGYPMIWQLLTEGRWADGVAELRQSAKQFGSRLLHDADLLQRAIDKKALPNIAAQ